MLNTDRPLLLVIVATLLVKLLIAHFLPMTGDEAYFIVWGKHPDFGFYDHTPMAGWFLTAMLAVSDAEVWLRLPQILTTTFIGWAIYLLLRRQHEDVAVMAASLYLLAPINVLGVMMTTDTPLLLFSFLSALGFYLAQRHDQLGWYLFSGLFLGLAFFSKFFAGLLGVAYFIYLLLFVRRGMRPWLGLLVVVAGTLPFIGLNLWWNYTHCWNNYLFNLMNRTSSSQFSYTLPLKYLATLLYLVTPPLIWYLGKHGRQIPALLRGDRFGVFLGLFLIPYGLFFILSFWVSIGLHWLLSFYPFVFLGIASLFSIQQLRRSLYFMLPFTVLHVILFIVVLALSPGLFKNNENTYKDLVYGMYAGEIASRIGEYKPEYLLATDSYTESALLSYAAREHVVVMGVGSHHARQDDQLTDFRQLDGKNILVLSYYDNARTYAPFFESTEARTLTVEGATFYYVLGKNFNYQAYRKGVIEKIMQRYYQIPEDLPVGQCYMFERYGRP